MIYLTHEQIRCRINRITIIHSDLYIEMKRHGSYKKEYAMVDKELRALMAIRDYPDARLAKEQIDIPLFERNIIRVMSYIGNLGWYIIVRFTHVVVNAPVGLLARGERYNLSIRGYL